MGNGMGDHTTSSPIILDMASEASLAPRPPGDWRGETPAPAADLLRR